MPVESVKKWPSRRKQLTLWGFSSLQWKMDEHGPLIDDIIIFKEVSF
jgi:hypothetical protein